MTATRLLTFESGPTNCFVPGGVLLKRCGALGQRPGRSAAYLEVLPGQAQPTEEAGGPNWRRHRSAAAIRPLRSPLSFRARCRDIPGPCGALAVVPEESSPTHSTQYNSIRSGMAEAVRWPTAHSMLTDRAARNARRQVSSDARGPLPAKAGEPDEPPTSRRPEGWS